MEPQITRITQIAQKKPQITQITQIDYNELETEFLLRLSLIHI